MFDFFNNIIAFITSIGDMIIGWFEMMGGFLSMLLAVPEFFGTLYFLPSPLASAVILTGNIAVIFMIVGRSLGGK